MENRERNFFSKCKIAFKGHLEDLQNDGKTVVLTVALTFVILIASCLAVFFTVVQGAEKVLVPDVTGKSLTDALLELQAKELYPKIQLKYSELPGDKGTVLDQNPASGAIVKAYRRVTLTVSRGIPIDFIDDYTGKKIDEVKNALEFLFSGGDSLVEIAPAVYKTDEAPAGTILAQFPAAGTSIDERIRLQFVVSSGTEIPVTEVPEINGLSIKQFLSKIDEYKVAVDFSVEEDEESPAGGTVVSAQDGKEVSLYARIPAVLRIRPRADGAESVQGIFSVQLPEYPYPVPVRLDAQDKDGKLSAAADFSHPGMNCTIPYDVKKGTVLILYVLGEEYARTVAE